MHRFPTRPERRRAPVAALAAAAALAVAGLPALADSHDDDVEDKVEEIVEDRAEQEATDGEPAGADVGESDYNIEDCRPANDGMAAQDEAGGDETDAEEDGDDGSETVVAVADDVEEKELDPCRDVDK